MRTIIDAAECWMDRNPVMMEKRIMRNIERVRKREGWQPSVRASCMHACKARVVD